jgi:hypothetical protein
MTAIAVLWCSARIGFRLSDLSTPPSGYLNKNPSGILPLLHEKELPSSTSPDTSLLKTSATHGSYYWNCTPTHHACDNYQGLLHIESGDYGGAGGTVFFQFVIGQLIYADQHHLLPFVHFDNFSHLVYDPQVHDMKGYGAEFTALGGAKVPSVRDPRMYHAIYPGPPEYSQNPNKEYVTVHLNGTGVWNHYFHPVSDFCPGDLSCAQKPLLKMERAHVSPGLHIYAPWSPKIWRYGPMPDHIGQPHIPLTEWVLPYRKDAAAIVKKYYRVQPDVMDHVNPNITDDCLGIHIRWSDKGNATRRRIQIAEFVPIMKAYIRAREDSRARVCIYLATDAQQVVQEAATRWPRPIVDHLILSQATVRSPDDTAVFHLDNHHKTNLEVLRDVLELSSCGFLVHGNSAVSESALYMNPSLIYQSVNLEDPKHPLRHSPTFEALVRNVSQGVIDKKYWNDVYKLPRHWWEPSTVKHQIDYCCTLHNASRSAVFELSSHWLGSFMPVTRWVFRVFIKLWQDLSITGDVIVDPLWPTWFVWDEEQHGKSVLCQFTLNKLSPDVQVAIRSMAGNPFFQKRYRSVTEEFEKESTSIRTQMKVYLQALLSPKQHIRQQADRAFEGYAKHAACLGVHIPDPGYRRKGGRWTQQNYPQSLYDDFIDAFVEGGGTCLYLATDSYSIWKAFLAKNITAMVFTQREAVRNRHHVPAHFMEESMQRLGSEALVDIWNLQRCDVLIHGYSPLSEAALFWNPDLTSVSMRDRTSLDGFAALVQSIVGRKKLDFAA